jgi:hypothetical protein
VMLQTGFVPGSVARNRPELAWELLFAYGPRNDRTYGQTADSSHLVLLHFTIPLWVFCVYAVTQVTFPVSAMDIVCLLSLPRVAMSVRCRLSSVLSFLSRVSAFVGARSGTVVHTQKLVGQRIRNGRVHWQVPSLVFTGRFFLSITHCLGQSFKLLLWTSCSIHREHPGLFACL